MILKSPIRSIRINIEFLIKIFIISSVIGVGISYGDFYLFHLLLVLLLISGLLKLKETEFKFISLKPPGNFELLFIIMVLWYSFTILWAPNIIYAFKYLFYLGCGISIAWLIIIFTKEERQYKTLFKSIGIIFTIELIIALLESFTAFRLPISPYSSLVGFFGKEPIQNIDFGFSMGNSNLQPPTGFHWNTNNLAISMLMMLPFILCQKRTYIKMLGSIAIILITVMASSRAVFLGLLVIFFLYLVVIKKRIVTLFIIWSTIFGILFAMFQLRESENPKLNEIANTVEILMLYLTGDLDAGGSLQWRRELLDNGISALLNSNGLGVGSGGSVAVQETIGGVAGRFTSMHNYWIEILVEAGIVFFAIFILWYLNIILNLFRVIKKNSSNFINYMASALFLSMIGFIPAAIAASSTVYFFPMWIMFGLSISVIYQFRNNQFKNEIKSSVKFL